MLLVKRNRVAPRKTPRLVVRHHKPIFRWTVWTVLTLFVIGGSWVLYNYGRERAGFDLVSLMQNRGDLMSTIRDLEGQMDDLRGQIAIHERTIQIERQAYHEISRNLEELQEENIELKEEVAFYRGIVSPDEAAQGLHIQSFKLSPTGQQRVYRYKLILTQIMKNDRIIRGDVSVMVEGIKSGVQQRYNLLDFVKNGNRSLDFRFKYFQNLEGEFALPDGFLPTRVVITVDPAGGATIKEDFNWSQLI